MENKTRNQNTTGCPGCSNSGLYQLHLEVCSNPCICLSIARCCFVVCLSYLYIFPDLMQEGGNTIWRSNSRGRRDPQWSICAWHQSPD